MKILIAAKKAPKAGVKKEGGEQELTDFLRAVFLLQIRAASKKPLGPEQSKYLGSDKVRDGILFLKKYGAGAGAVNAYSKMLKNFQTKGFSESGEAGLAGLAKALTSKTRNVHTNLDIPRDKVKFLKDWILFARKGSKKALRRMVKEVGVLQDPGLLKIVTPKGKVEVEDKKAELKKHVKKVTGKEGLILSPEEALKLKEKDKGAYKAYLKARRNVYKAGKDRLFQAVRHKGELMPIDEARELLDKEGHVHNLPKDFKGFVNEHGVLHTTTGKPIAGLPGGPVQMNPKYDPEKDDHYVFRSRAPGAKKPSRFFTHDFIGQHRESKFEKVQDLVGGIADLRGKWSKDLGSKDKDGIMATLLETAYQTQARIGSPKAKTKGIRTYGLSTVQGKHVKIGDNQIKLEYDGKDGVHQTNVLKGVDKESKQAIAQIKALKEKAGPDDPIFTYKGKPIKATGVNKYFKSLGAGTTVHKFRTLKGTMMLGEILKKKPKKGVSEKEATKWLKTQLLTVGKQLGHVRKGEVTAATALRHYVAPQLVSDYYSSLGLRPPNTIEKIINAAKGTKNKKEVRVSLPMPRVNPYAPGEATKIKRDSSWWKGLTHEQKHEYLKDHPDSKFKI